MTDLTNWTSDWNGGKETCPVLDNPEPDCYCLNLTSQQEAATGLVLAEVEPDDD